MSYGFYNPMMNAQQRLNQLETQYPQFAQPQYQQPPQQQQTNIMRVVPVTNIEEANATQVDVQGTPTFFYNQAKNEVYMKRVNLNTGLADFIKFERTQMSNIESEAPKDVNISKEDLKLLNDKLDRLLATVQIETVEENKNKGAKNVKQ